MQYIKLIFMTDKRGSRYLHGVPYFPVTMVRDVRYRQLFDMPLFIIRLGVSCLQSFILLWRWRVRRVIAFGGYVSLPCMAMGWLLGCRLFAHEQNARMGRVNRWCLPYIDGMALGFAETDGMARRYVGKTRHTHHVVRQDIIEAQERGDTHRHDGEKLTILVVGGSQGASVFSSLIPQALSHLTREERHRVVVMQQCLSDQLTSLRQRYHRLGVDASLSPFFNDMGKLLALADMAISRAGASIIGELLITKTPALFIPYPFAQDNHQHANAMRVQAWGGAWLYEQSDVAISHKIGETLRHVLGNPQRLKAMSSCLAPHATPHAGEHIVDMLLACVGHEGGTPS